MLSYSCEWLRNAVCFFVFEAYIQVRYSELCCLRFVALLFRSTSAFGHLSEFVASLVVGLAKEIESFMRSFICNLGFFEHRQVHILGIFGGKNSRRSPN